MLCQNIKVLSFLVMNVSIKQHKRHILEDISSHTTNMTSVTMYSVQVEFAVDQRSVMPLTVFREGRTLLDQGCPNFDEIFFGASVHEKIEI